ncbi:MAG: prefoldin subunit alpha [Candidatus Micrarchaeia archaeon]
MAEDNLGIDELRYMQQLYEQQYRMLSDSVTAASNELNELTAVQKALDDSGLIEGRELFTHVGSSFYVRSRAVDPKTFVVGIGGGYLAEMPIDYAKEYIAREIEKKSAELSAVMGDRKKVEEELLGVLHRIDASAHER